MPPQKCAVMAVPNPFVTDPTGVPCHRRPQKAQPQRSPVREKKSLPQSSASRGGAGRLEGQMRRVSSAPTVKPALSRPRNPEARRPKPRAVGEGTKRPSRPRLSYTTRVPHQSVDNESGGGHGHGHGHGVKSTPFGERGRTHSSKSVPTTENHEFNVADINFDECNVADINFDEMPRSKSIPTIGSHAFDVAFTDEYPNCDNQHQHQHRHQHQHQRRRQSVDPSSYKDRHTSGNALSVDPSPSQDHRQPHRIRHEVKLLPGWQHEINSRENEAEFSFSEMATCSNAVLFNPNASVLEVVAENDDDDADTDADEGNWTHGNEKDCDMVQLPRLLSAAVTKLSLSEPVGLTLKFMKSEGLSPLHQVSSVPFITSTIGGVDGSRLSYRQELTSTETTAAAAMTMTTIVDEISPDSPFRRTTLKVGDELLTVNGRRVRNARRASAMISRTRLGEQLVLVVSRGGRNLAAKEENREHEDDYTEEDAGNYLDGKADAMVYYMVKLPLISTAVMSNHRREEASSLWEPFGIELISANNDRLIRVASVVESLGDENPFTKAGLRPGDVVLAVDGQPVRSVSDAEDALRRSLSSTPPLLTNGGGNGDSKKVVPILAYSFQETHHRVVRQRTSTLSQFGAADAYGWNNAAKVDGWDATWSEDAPDEDDRSYDDDCVYHADLRLPGTSTAPIRLRFNHDGECSFYAMGDKKLKKDDPPPSVSLTSLFSCNSDIYKDSTLLSSRTSLETTASLETMISARIKVVVRALNRLTLKRVELLALLLSSSSSFSTSDCGGIARDDRAYSTSRSTSAPSLPLHTRGKKDVRASEEALPPTPPVFERAEVHQPSLRRLRHSAAVLSNCASDEKHNASWDSARSSSSSSKNRIHQGRRNSLEPAGSKFAVVNSYRRAKSDRSKNDRTKSDAKNIEPTGSKITVSNSYHVSSSQDQQIASEPPPFRRAKSYGNWANGARNTGSSSTASVASKASSHSSDPPSSDRHTLVDACKLSDTERVEPAMNIIRQSQTVRPQRDIPYVGSQVILREILVDGRGATSSVAVSSPTLATVKSSSKSARTAIAVINKGKGNFSSSHEEKDRHYSGDDVKLSQNSHHSHQQQKNHHSRDPQPASTNGPIHGSRLDSIEATYEIKPEIIGTGSFGVVRDCLHRRTRELFVVKSICKESVQYFELLENEISLHRRADHCNIVRVIDVIEDSAYIHIIMEKCKGGDLSQKVAENGVRFQERRIAGIISSLLDVVSYLHDQNIIHRDLKAEHLMLASDDINAPIKIIDFGLSILHDPKTGDAPLTALAGSHFYMAPEVIQHRYGKACDLWSVGVITYLLLTTRMPFDASSEEELHHKIVSGVYAYPQWACMDIGSDAVDFISHLLVVDPKERWTAKEALGHPWIARYTDNDGPQRKPQEPRTE